MTLALYRMATSLGGPLIRLYLNQRVKRGKEDPARLDERLGRASIPRPAGKLVWIHGASVGEALSTLPLIDAVREHYPDWTILLTTGTVTSARLMAERLPEGVIHQFIPVDRVSYVRRFLEHWKPNLGLWVESEFWPNLVVETRASAVPMVVLNGRMSEKSFTGWMKNRAMIRQLLTAFRLVLAQSDIDGERFSALGAKSVAISGNLKFACAPLPADTTALIHLQDQLSDRPCWLAASTHAGEEDIIGRTHAALKAVYPRLLTIIVPRHPERGPAVATGLNAFGLNVALRSQNEAINGETDIYVADTMGELGLFMRLVDIVFIGKTLAGGGGQNPLEPAQLNCALIFGPDMSNFQAVSETLLNGGAALNITNEATLIEAIALLLSDADKRAAMCAAAHRVTEAEAGVVNRVMAALAPYFEGGPDART